MIRVSEHKNISDGYGKEKNIANEVADLPHLDGYWGQFVKFGVRHKYGLLIPKCNCCETQTKQRDTRRSNNFEALYMIKGK